MTGDQHESSRSQRRFHFVVDIDDVGTALHFAEVSGLDVESRLIEYRAGSKDGFATTKMPGMAKPGHVTLKRGIAAKDDRFSDWHAQIGRNEAQRATVRISLLDEDGARAMVWKLANAFPTKVTGPDFNAHGNEVAIEEIEIEHEGLTIADDDDD
jgi:phage tail-like protein